MKGPARPGIEESRVSTDSKLDGRVTLGALVTPDTLRGLCGPFVRLAGVGCLASIATARSCTASSSARPPPATGRRPFPDLPPPDEKVSVVEVPSGCEYLRARLDNQLEPVGELFLGPYFPAEAGIGADGGHRGPGPGS